MKKKETKIVLLLETFEVWKNIRKVFFLLVFLTTFFKEES